MTVIKMMEILSIELGMDIGIDILPSEDFNGSQGGIWFRTTESFWINGLQMFDYNADDEVHIRGVHRKLNKILEDNGFFAEPYDSGTLMAYPS